MHCGNFEKAHFRRTDLRFSNLAEASLIGAGKVGANFRGSDLSRANWLRATLSVWVLGRGNGSQSCGDELAGAKNSSTLQSQIARSSKMIANS